MRGGTGAVLSSVARDSLRVNVFDPFDFPKEAVPQWDFESGVVDVLLVVLRASLKGVGIVPDSVLQALDAILQMGDDQLMEDFVLLDG